MSHDERPGVLPFEVPQQQVHGSNLWQGARVAWPPLRVQASFVADAHGMAVVVLAMRSYLVQQPAGVHVAVAGDVEVIADVPEFPVLDMLQATGFVVQALSVRCGRTMDDE